MKKEFTVHHVSTGDLLRNHVNKMTLIGTEIKKYMLMGSLVPDSYLFQILLEEMKVLEGNNSTKNNLSTDKSHDFIDGDRDSDGDRDNDSNRDCDVDGDRILLLDGFPRTVLQAIELDKLMNVDAVISLEVPHQIVIDRLSNR